MRAIRGVVTPDTPIGDIAKVLRDHGISAVPVVDEAGSPVGMVSEGDLGGGPLAVGGWSVRVLARQGNGVPNEVMVISDNYD